MQFAKKHWIESLVFGFILAVLIIDLNPDYTFINKAADSIGYLYSAKYMYPSYHTSPPLYLLVSHLFLMLPFGTEAWRMGLFSVLSTFTACIFIFLLIKHYIPNKRLYPILGVLIYGLSAIVICQSIIVNTYATTCMLAIGAYYFAVKKHWKLMALFCGMGLATHLLFGFAFIIFVIAFKEYRTNWKCWLITLAFGVFYLYIPLTNREPFMWLPDPSTVNTIWATITDTISVINMLIGSLSIWDLPKRIIDVVLVMGISIGIISIIPLVYYFKVKKIWRNPLFWLSVVPICLFIGELDMNTFDYMMLAMPFLSIAICLGLYEFSCKYNGKILQVAIVIFVVGIGLYNVNFFDIGRTLDKDLSATKLYNEEFSKLPDNAIFMPNYAWEWEAIYKYNKDYNKSIYPICIDILPSDLYQGQLRKDGINVIDSEHENISMKAQEIANSIVELNDNVWTTRVIDSRTFGSMVIPTNGDILTVNKVDIKRIEEISDNPQWKFKPYNPYDIMTTSVFITDWSYLLYSNWNVRLFAGLASIGMILNWFIFILPNKGNKYGYKKDRKRLI